jgi:hypothetical protein
MRATTPFALALVAAAAVPASASAATSRYTIVKASGSERLSYTADAQTCATHGTCGDSGRVTYRFRGTPHRGRMTLATRRSGRTAGVGVFRTTGTTVADVSYGDGGECSQTVRHRAEVFTLDSLRHNLARLLFTLHPRSHRTDYLATDCLAPSETDVARDHGLPQASFRRSGFDAARTSFRLFGSSRFVERGWRGTVRWTLSYRVIRRR